jgi:hypothetical protein
MSDEREPRTRSAAERVRLEGSIRNLRGLIDGIETALKMKGPVGTDVAQALLTASSSLALQLARHDAYDLYEEDAKNRAKSRPKPCGRNFVTTPPGRIPGTKEVCSETSPCQGCAASISQWDGAQKQRPF